MKICKEKSRGLEQDRGFLDGGDVYISIDDQGTTQSIFAIDILPV